MRIDLILQSGHSISGKLSMYFSLRFIEQVATKQLSHLSANVENVEKQNFQSKL